MQDYSANKRIAINTVLLYVRMIFLLGISFYTTRAILEALGVVDLGIYNVVGGVVAMMGFLNGSLSSASSRFITFSLGTNNPIELTNSFNAIITIHILFGVIILIIAETLGLWFVLHKLIIPAERLEAAIWVYQSAVISSIIIILSAPFNADIIAHEKMSAFAYISIFEAVAKLGIIFILFNTTQDKLIVYAILLVIVQCIVMSLYISYCRKHFFESHFKLMWDVKKVKTIFSYAGWVMSGSFAYICSTQGLNILLNLFFGPAVNAARAIANQLQGAINQFTTNFQTAVKPQITKNYAQGNHERMHYLILASSKFGSLLMLMLIIPVITMTEFFLGIWLVDIPEHTVGFVRIMLLVGIIGAMKDPTMTAIHATGKIKKTEIVEMIFMLSVLPLAYILLKYYNISPEVTLCVYLLIELCTQIARIWVVYPSVGLQKKYYFTKVLFPITLTGLISVILSFIIYSHWNNSLFENIFSILIIEIVIILSIFFLGLSNTERSFILRKIKQLKIFTI